MLPPVFQQGDAAVRVLPGSRSWCWPPAGHCVWGSASSGWSPSTFWFTAPACCWNFMALVGAAIYRTQPAASFPRARRQTGCGVDRRLSRCCCWVFRSSAVNSEQVLGMSSLIFSLLLILGGFVAYGIDLVLRPGRIVQPQSGLAARVAALGEASGAEPVQVLRAFRRGPKPLTCSSPSATIARPISIASGRLISSVFPRYRLYADGTDRLPYGAQRDHAGGGSAAEYGRRR